MSTDTEAPTYPEVMAAAERAAERVAAWPEWKRRLSEPTPDPDDSAAWPLPRAGLEWWQNPNNGRWWIEIDGVYAVFLTEHGSEAQYVAGLDPSDPDAPAIEAVLRARESARRAKGGAT